MDTEESQPPTNSSKGRYVWKKYEEDHLIRCMTNEYSDKWSAENGFRSSFFTLLAHEVKKVMLDTAIEASPHTVSKVRNWKTTYNCINDIVSKSGFGWNDVNKCIIVDEPPMWEEYEKANPKCKGYNGKPFPYYDAWVVLFGKDRATGKFAEDFTLLGFIPSASAPQASTLRTSTPRSLTHHNSTTPTALPHPSMLINAPFANAEGKKVKKRSQMRMGDEKFQEGMNNWMNSTATHIADMAKSMEFPREVAARCERILEELTKLDYSAAVSVDCHYLRDRSEG